LALVFSWRRSARRPRSSVAIIWKAAADFSAASVCLS
jgi:hypothetical protein